MPQESGLFVQKVVKTSPLGIIGLKGGDIEMILDSQKVLAGGDIILEFNGVKIESSDEALVKLGKIIEARDADDPIEFTVLRAGKVITLGRRK